MDSPSPNQHRQVSTPLKQRTRPNHRPAARSAGEPYKRRSDQTEPQGDISPSVRTRRCLSTGSSPISRSETTTTPKREPSAGVADKTIREIINLVSEYESPQPNRIFINLVTDDESSQSNDPPAEPHVPVETRVASPVRPARRVSISDTTPTRPSLQRQTKSEPSTRPKTTPTKIDKRIQACLRKPLPDRQNKFKGVGNNYIFETTTAEQSSDKIVKIGVTRGAEQARFDNIAKGCRHLLIEEQNDPEHMPIRLYVRAEQLMHRELEDFRHSFKCQCKVKSHREYFNVDKSVALEVVQRWREFCKREPYDEDGKLRSFWEHRLRQFNTYGDSGTKIDHPERADRWRRFMNPTRCEVLWYDSKEAFKKIWRWRWLAVSLIQSFIIAVLAFPRLYPVFLFAFMVGWVLVETSDLDHPVFLNALNWAADGIRKPALLQHSAAGPTRPAGKTSEVGREEEGLEEQEYGDLGDVESCCSSDVEGLGIDFEDGTDTSVTEDAVSTTGSDETRPSTAD
ncbi:hypothetical protein JX265_005535 [Neoarthrinium moseri]|uniref:Bacteriophage T5 Orf172 DNA-binding domain-containing protein n=1 Tax=Neoarthrinium moseri TaxID=1658444 RepID=A0A9P9WNS4_9PEZI|nr:hypothetical protein JX266_006629 [Neoarthrinium moseri]KAI1872655.1 hypothetical protein JX265_005535 [Neoarthrinium moseri]